MLDRIWCKRALTESTPSFYEWSDITGEGVTCAVGTQARQKLEPDVPLNAHRASVDLENVGPSLQIRESKLHFAVQPARSHQRRVQSIRSIGGHQHLHQQQS